MAFEGILAPQDRKPKRWLRVTIAASLGVHVAALAAGVVHSLWQVEEMALPAVQVTLTAAVPPPPPPPPPPARRASPTKTTPRNPEPKPETLVQPKETPKEPPAEEPAGSEDDAAEGEAGGEVGGVAGGVVGGVVGSPAPPPPPRVAAGPKMVSPQIGSRQLLINPQSPAYRPKIPRALATSGQSFVAVVRMCVSAQGAVTGVSVMKGAGAAIDSQLPSVLGRWRYKPLLIDGRPTPFCYLLRYEIAER